MPWPGQVLGPTGLHVGFAWLVACSQAHCLQLRLPSHRVLHKQRGVLGRDRPGLALPTTYSVCDLEQSLGSHLTETGMVVRYTGPLGELVNIQKVPTMGPGALCSVPVSPSDEHTRE